MMLELGRRLQCDSEPGCGTTKYTRPAIPGGEDASELAGKEVLVR